MAVDAGLTKETNEQRQAARLRRQILKQHHWRVSTWAKAQAYINERQAALQELGFEPEELFEPDFSNEAMLEEYASLTSKS